ncbi:MAG: hypothetical protein JWM25_715, partial [Thermoleophilia bacterium]|nr:hypothetical protein [Thermoleophilia bacterium]
MERRPAPARWLTLPATLERREPTSGWGHFGMNGASGDESMPVPRILSITRQTAEHARSAIAQVGNDAIAARARLPHMPDGMPATKLVGLHEFDAARGVAELRGMFGWRNDMNCFERASLGAHRMNQLLGDGSITGPMDASRAAVAVMSTPPDTDWVFHAATVYEDATTGTLRVVDFVSDRQRDMSLDEWATMYGRSVDDVRIQHAFGEVMWENLPGRDLPTPF